MILNTCSDAQTSSSVTGGMGIIMPSCIYSYRHSYSCVCTEISTHIEVCCKFSCRNMSMCCLTGIFKIELYCLSEKKTDSKCSKAQFIYCICDRGENISLCM